MRTKAVTEREHYTYIISAFKYPLSNDPALTSPPMVPQQGLLAYILLKRDHAQKSQTGYCTRLHYTYCAKSTPNRTLPDSLIGTV